MTKIVRGRTKEEVVESTVKEYLGTILHKHQDLLTKMTTGDLWEEWVVLTAEEMSRLRAEQNFSNNQLNVFLKKTSQMYVDSWLKAMGA